MLSGSFSTFAPVASASRTHVGGVRGPEGRPQVPRPRSTAHDHARRTGVGPAQLELVRRPAHGREPERMREPLRGRQVGLGELQPGQVEHLDDGVLRTARVLAAQRTLLAVQVVVGPVVTGHLLLLGELLTISSLTNPCSVKSSLKKSSFLTGSALGWVHAHPPSDAEERIMSNAATQEPNRLDRRKARTRAALIRAAQTLIAEGRTNVPILEITQAADVGMGSFYNHFETKEQLFEAAVEAVMDGYGQLLDDLTGDIEDPAEVFACSFRLTGRLQRKEPELSRVFLNNVLRLLSADSGLAPRARRDIKAAVDAGRFDVEDLDVAVTMAAGALIALGQLLHDQPERDVEETTDRVTEELLRMFGVRASAGPSHLQLPLPDIDTVRERRPPRAAGRPRLDRLRRRRRWSRTACATCH